MPDALCCIDVHTHLVTFRLECLVQALDFRIASTHLVFLVVNRLELAVVQHLML
jgi:hypothetical protein